MQAFTGAQRPIAINRTFNLPIDTVWKAWTEPEIVKKWWGAKDHTCPVCKIDLKEGGKYFASMREEDGDELYSTGVYKEIVPCKKLVMTDNFSDSEGNIIVSPEDLPGEWPEELMISVELAEENGKTNIVLKQDGVPVELYENCMCGWQESLDKLEQNIK